jgi:hypothetical protein
MEKINNFAVSSLMTMVMNLIGCVFAHITTETTVKIPKKYGISGVVTKVVSKIVQLNFSYENAVNNRLAREGKDKDFEAQKLPWGEWFVANKIIAHKGKFYLRYYDINNGNVLNKAYFVNGKPATEDELAIIKEYEKSTNKPSNTQGLSEEHEVRPLVVAEENIIALKCGEIDYHRALDTKFSYAL